MRDLLEVLKTAKAKRVYAADAEFRMVLDRLLDADRELSLNWDDGAGEEWAMLHHRSGGCMMLSRRLGLVFAVNGYDVKPAARILSELTVIQAEGYSSDAWCIDPELLKTEVPELDWHACSGAVNTDSFSLADLYFATV